MSFLPGLKHVLNIAAAPVPRYVLEKMKKANTIAEGIVLPHQVQSKAARLTRFGKIHTKVDTPHNGMLLVNGVLTFFTMGVYAAIIAVAIQLAKEERARRIRDKLKRYDAATSTQVDLLGAEADRLEKERLRIAGGGAVDPNFLINQESGITEGQ